MRGLGSRCSAGFQQCLPVNATPVLIQLQSVPTAVPEQWGTRFFQPRFWGLSCTQHPKNSTQRLQLWWPAAAPGLAPSQQQRGSPGSLWSQPPQPGHCPLCCKMLPNYSDLPGMFLMLLPLPCLAWPCSALRERAKSISQDVAASLRYLRMPKYCVVTLKPTLAKDGPRAAPCSVCPQSTLVGVLLQPGSGAVSRLANNLQPSMTTTINGLISSVLEKDILVFARPTVACPEPWAGASAAGGAGDALSQEYPAPCSGFLCTRTD